MNNSAKVEAFKSFYNQAKEALASNDLDKAKSLYLKAATLANEISKESTSYDVRMEYQKIAINIINYVKHNCSKVKEKVNANDDENISFEPINDDVKKVTFADVAGLEEVKNSIIFNVIEPLKNPELAKAYNVSAGARVLLYGPPGTGKTFIASAIAGEVDAKFYSVNCQELISKYLGDSSKALDKLFTEAQKNERAIIFFDEFDSVASKREDSSGGSDGEIARFVATFLTKVDGLKKSETCKMLLLVAATNRPWAIDSAMLRGGRFDTQIYVSLPDFAARLFMIEKQLKTVPKDDDVSLDNIAYRLEGYGGGDITAICKRISNEAYRRAVKSKQIENVTLKDVDKIIENSRPSVDEDDLTKFDLFKRGIAF